MKLLSPVLLISIVLGLAPGLVVRGAESPRPAAASVDTVLVFPFENTSKRPEYNWIGESFCEMLSELLDMSADVISIRPEERNLAYEREGLPVAAILTRATSIKVGERAGADLVIAGTYRVDGEKDKETVTVAARLIDIREGRVVGRELNRGGKLTDLQEIQGEMAYEILKQRNPALPFSKDDLVGSATKVPAAAFADFMKAITTADRQNKALFLARSIETYSKERKDQGQFTQAIFELGRLSYLDGKWQDAIKLLQLVDAKYPRATEAAFYVGVSYSNLKQNDQAVRVFTDLVPKMPLYEVYNNAGVVYVRAGRFDDANIYLKPAAEAATRDLDTQFNYGYSLWLKGDAVAAADQLQKAIRRKPADGEAVRYTALDGEAFYLLWKASERAGRSADAAEALDQAKRHLPSFAQWETKKAIPDLTRLKPRFSRAALIRLKRDRDSATAMPPAAGTADGSAAVSEAMERARGFFQAGRDREALDELGRVLQINPDNAEAHLLRGRVFERTGEYDRAVEALKAAIFWDPKSVAGYVLLGRIYAFRNDCPNAQSSLRKALQLDPASADAQALKRTVDAKCGG
jgi:tetratricopeptide (TPR) repeat protein